MTLQQNEFTSEHPDVMDTSTPGYKLYSVKGAMIATFFGTPLAGGYLMAKNYQRLGNQSGARQALFYSVLAVIASLIAGYLLPENFPSMAVSLPILLAMGQAMKQLQGPALEQHLQNHGQVEYIADPVALQYLQSLEYAESAAA